MKTAMECYGLERWRADCSSSTASARSSSGTREPGNPIGLPDNLVSTVFEDAEGVLWVGTENGLSRFVRKPAAFVNYRHEARNPQSLPDNPITAVLADSKGFLWIAGAGKLNQLDRRTGELTVYRRNPKIATVFPRARFSPFARTARARSGWARTVQDWAVWIAKPDVSSPTGTNQSVLAA